MSAPNENGEWPCLYCGDLSARRTSEHVLQRGLGANLTLPKDVCTHCNTDVFSPLDDKLVTFVREIVYAGHPDNPSKRNILEAGLPLRLDPATGLWTNVRVSRALDAVPMPQLIFRSETEFQIVLDPLVRSSPKKMLETLVSELCDPPSLGFREQFVPGYDPEVQLAVVRSAHRKYVLRGGSKNKLQGLRKQIESGRLGDTLRSVSMGEPQKNSAEQPELYWSMATELDNYARAMAKTALNFACAVLGPKVVRQVRFDPMRKFALTGEPSDPCSVSFLFGEETVEGQHFANRLGKPGHHTLVLGTDHTGAYGLTMALYNRAFGRVDLVEAAKARDLHRQGVAIGWFDHTARTHEIVRPHKATLAQIQEFEQRTLRLGYSTRGGSTIR